MTNHQTNVTYGSIPLVETTSQFHNQENKTYKEIIFSYLRQIVLAAIISSGVYVVSFLVSSTSLLPIILNDNSQNVNYTAEDLKWLASGPILFSIVGNFGAVYLSETFGPTVILRQSLLYCFLLYILIAYIPTLTVLWVTRIVLWTLVGTFDIICVPLIALLSEPNIRGITGVLTDLTGSFGMFFFFVSLSFVSRPNAILINSIPVFLGFIGSFFVPESPYWLIQRGKLVEAEKSIGMSIGPSRTTKRKELLQEIFIRYEITEENKGQDINKKIPLRDQIKLLSKPENWKPLLLSIFVFAFREFGGNYIIFFYAVTFFEEANISIDVSLCTIIISVARMISTFLSAGFQDKFGRRFILIGASFVSAICLAVSGLVLYFGYTELYIVPLIGIIIFILMTGVGFGPVPFIIMGEIIPPDIKFLGTAIAYSSFNFYQFLMVFIMPIILRKFRVGTLLIAFGILNSVFGTIIYFILPETKCKTLIEIEKMFK